MPLTAFCKSCVMQKALDLFRANLDRVRSIHATYLHFSGQVTPALDLSDLLRAELVLTVSALDHFVHELARLGMMEIWRGTRPATPAYQNHTPFRGRRTMRVMVKFSFPTESGNAAIRSGKVEKVFQQLMEDLKPEATYFYPEGGQRAGHFVVNMEDPSQVAGAVERFCFGLNAKIEMVPVMNGDDLHEALAGVQDIAKRYG